MTALLYIANLINLMAGVRPVQIITKGQERLESPKTGGYGFGRQNKK